MSWSFASDVSASFSNQVRLLPLTALQAVFEVNSAEHSIRLTISGTFQGDAGHYVWLMPFPSKPDVQVNTDDRFNGATIDELAYQKDPLDPTNRFFDTSQSDCRELFSYGAYADGYGYPSALIEQYAVLSSDQARVWLAEHQLSGDLLPVAEDSPYYVALDISAEDTPTDIPPINITYQADEPRLPLAVLSAGTPPDQAVSSAVWVLADMPYLPAEEQVRLIDYSRFRFANALLSLGFEPSTQGAYGLQDEYQRLQRLTEGQFYAALYVQPTVHLFSDVEYGDYYTQVQERVQLYRYLTRLEGQASPRQIHHPSRFIPAPNLAPISNIVKITDVVDLLDLYGCSSDTTIPQDMLADVPSGLTRIDAIQFAVAHPEGWQLSQWQVGEQTVYALSPQAVDADVLRRVGAGENVPPIFLFARIDQLDIFDDDWQQFVEQTIGTAFNSRLRYQSFWVRYRVTKQPVTAYSVVYALLTSESDWMAHEATYRAMLAYAAGYQYYGRADWRNTLFLDWYPLLAIPYPDGWVKSKTSSGTVRLRSEAVQATLAIGSAGQILRSEFGLVADEQTALKQLADLLGWSAEIVSAVDSDSCQTGATVYPFEGQQFGGYVRFEGHIMLLAYADRSHLGENKLTLSELAQSVQNIGCEGDGRG